MPQMNSTVLKKTAQCQGHFIKGPLFHCKQLKKYADRNTNCFGEHSHPAFIQGVMLMLLITFDG